MNGRRIKILKKEITKKLGRAPFKLEFKHVKRNWIKLKKVTI